MKCLLSVDKTLMLQKGSQRAPLVRTAHAQKAAVSSGTRPWRAATHGVRLHNGCFHAPQVEGLLYQAGLKPLSFDPDTPSNRFTSAVFSVDENKPCLVSFSSEEVETGFWAVDLKRKKSRVVWRFMEFLSVILCTKLFQCFGLHFTLHAMSLEC